MGTTRTPFDPPPRKRSGAAAVRLGAQRERQEVALRLEAGWFSFRVGGHSATRGKADEFDVCDVAAMRAIVDGLTGTEVAEGQHNGAEVLMIEVKSTAGGPFERFGPAQREALIRACELAGATPLLVWWPAGGERKEIPVSEWP